MDLKQSLYQRGHELKTQGTLDHIYVPTCSISSVKKAFSEVLFLLMLDSDFRRSLRDWSHDNSIQSETTAFKRVIGYMNLCSQFNVPGIPFKDRTRYSKTFEWYIAELIKRKFGANSSGFSIRLADADPDDEFDCVGILDEGLFFAECKTGNAEIYSQIEKYVRRDAELTAKYSLLVVDSDSPFGRSSTEGLSLTDEQASICKIRFISRYKKAGEHDFYKIEASPNRFLFVCSAVEKLEKNIRHIIRYTNMLYDGHHDLNSKYPQQSVPFSNV